MKTFRNALLIVALAATLVAAFAVSFNAPTAQAAPSCPNGPDVHYISHNPQVCATIRFFCAENQTAFSNECGCGCIDLT